jgi:hypothetical protein
MFETSQMPSRWRSEKGSSSLFSFPLLLAILIFQLQRPICCRAQQQTEEEKKSADGDDLYILLDEISVFSCRGVKNEIKLTEEVLIKNGQLSLNTTICL